MEIADQIVDPVANMCFELNMTMYVAYKEQ